MEDLGLFEAWALWGQGKALSGMSLWDIPMIWWGRAGKIAAFFGGLTIVLDVIGPERIREFGIRIKGARTKGLEIWMGLLTSILTALIAIGALLDLLRESPLITVASVVTSTLALLFAPPILRRLVLGLGRLLENKRNERVIRWLAVMLFIGGFHFDLLAS